MLHVSTLSEARIVSAFCAVLCCKVSVPSQRALTSRYNKSRAQEFHPRARLSLHRPLTGCASALASVPHHLRPHTNSAGCSQAPSLEGLRIASLVPLVLGMRVVLEQLFEGGARPLPHAPRLVPDRPHGWQRRRHLQQLFLGPSHHCFRVRSTRVGLLHQRATSQNGHVYRHQPQRPWAPLPRRRGLMASLGA